MFVEWCMNVRQLREHRFESVLAHEGCWAGYSISLRPWGDDQMGLWLGDLCALTSGHVLGEVDRSGT